MAEETKKIVKRHRGMIKPGENRRRGAKELAKEISKQTDNGQEVVDFVLSVFRGTEPRLGTRPSDLKWAVEWLADRLWGKAPVQMEITAGQDTKIVNMIDYSKLSVKELKILQEAEEALRGVLEGDVLDV